MPQKQTQTTTWLISALAAAAVLCALSAGAHANNIYKWKDQNGVVHYGDQVPPQYTRRQRQVMNDQGMVVDVLPAQKTQTQIQAEKARREAIAQRQKQQQHDRMLLNTYRTVDELKNVRDKRIDTLDSRIAGFVKTIAELQQRQASLQQQMTRSPTKPGIASRLTTVVNNLKANEKALTNQRAIKAIAQAQYAADIQRYTTLKAH